MVGTMARPKWTPKNDAQRKAIADTKQAAENVKEAERALWKTVGKARDEGVPATHLADTIGVSNATFYRHVGQDDE